jgi:hypothetical protein
MPFAFENSRRYKSAMKVAAGAFILFAIIAVGCHTVSHVVTAPVRLVHHEPTLPPRSDVDVPGRPVPATPTPKPRVARTNSKTAKPSPSSSPKAPASNQPQFPVAKAVPGRPGVVYNPFDPKGGLIDVSGYASGSKVKDPDSQKIFVVP